MYQFTQLMASALSSSFSYLEKLKGKTTEQPGNTRAALIVSKPKHDSSPYPIS